MSSIRVSVDDDLGLIQFWCTKAESTDEQLLAKVQALYREIAPNNKYKKVIYRSGEKELSSLTAELLRYNANCRASA